MKLKANELNKVSISPSFLLLIVLCLFGGFFKRSLILLISLFFHELGHLFLIRLFKAKISSVSITGIGIFINVSDYYKLSLLKKVLISLGGIIVNILIVLITIHIPGVITKELMKINIILALFNCLPIYPLDGFQLIRHFLNCIYEDEYLNDLLSLVSMLLIAALFIIAFIYQSYGIMIILAVLSYKTLQLRKNRNILYLKKIFHLHH